MQFHRITRLKHIHRAADGGKIRPGDPDRVRVRIFQIQPRPDLPVLVFALDDLEFQLEILPVSRLGGFHFRFSDDSLVFPGRNRIITGRWFDFVRVEIDCGHLCFLCVMPCNGCGD